ncbi:ChrR family anti-sigma-E factor [Yunchengibacter salinarum]|uniref:ChrR family anti-sigma-E factor n=1 Tax=Yunchengibacter salinarum TaxID=3133399 RepID=UPI0035B60196
MVVNDVANTLLLDHATGVLPEPLDVMVSAHVAINEEARVKKDVLMSVGGRFLESVDPAPVSDTALESILSRIDTDPGSPPPSQATANSLEEDPNTAYDPVYRRVPKPLWPYVRKGAGKWRSVGGGVKEFRLNFAAQGYRASLLEIAPGRRIPSHTHSGREYTLVIDGAYDDGAMRVDRGDLVCNDHDDTHQPEADARMGCLCMAVLNAPLKFSGPLGWVINPFMKV